MANQVSARLKGDDYQHLTTWLHVLELKVPRFAVRLVTVEDETTGSADDVTVRYQPTSGKADCFHQIKYHVTQGGSYSTSLVQERLANGTSLLQKLFATWQELKADEPDRAIELHLVSNWSWDSADVVASQIDGETNALRPSFLAASAGTNLGKARKQWQDHVGAEDTMFAGFIADLRFYLGAACFTERARHASERMANLQLKHDDSALIIAAGIVRGWIKAGQQQISPDILEQALIDHDLYARSEEGCRIVYLTTIKKQSTDLPPDYVIDWRAEFEGEEQLKGHAVKDADAWNEKFLPELRRVEAQISEEAGCRLIRARGLARLSAWFAFGHTFSEVSRYIVEVDQYGNLWRTDAEASPDFDMTSANGSGENVEGQSDSVAVGISITGDLSADVRDSLRKSRLASHLLLLQPTQGTGREALVSSSNVVAFARKTKALIASYVRDRNAKTVCIYYYGPFSAACFLGHQMNAVGADIQIMEAQSDRSYQPSFLLK